MNLPPPPETEDIKELLEWCKMVYAWSQSPHINWLRLVPRSDAPTGDGAVNGVVYYDSDDETLKAHNGTAFQDTY